MGRRFRTNGPQIISEVIDGEAVVIHLGTGTYYSLRDTATFVWEEIGRGVPLDDVVSALSSVAPDAAAVDIGRTIDAFVSELVSEGLIVEAPGEGADAALPTPPPPSSYDPPQLERYSDMQDLILLDPVHDVDAEVGWPRAQ